MRTFFDWVHSLAYVVKGARAMRRGDDDGVIRNYSRAIEISPDDLDYYYARGHAYWHKRELGFAIADFSKVIDLNPENIYARLVRGALYQERGNLAQALRDLDWVLALADVEEALRRDPSDEKARKLRDRINGQIHLAEFRKKGESEPR
jgi:tetratricopeptide (TPR) repeat protein